MKEFSEQLPSYLDSKHKKTWLLEASKLLLDSVGVEEVGEKEVEFIYENIRAVIDR